VIAARSPLPRAGLLMVGLGIAVMLRRAIASSEGARSVPAGLLFAATLAFLAVAAGWRPGHIRPVPLVVGVLGAVGLVALPAWSRLATASPVTAHPGNSFLLWATIVTMVAASEELLLRGILFTSIETAGGTLAALAVTSAAFALLHVPLYGWGAVPLDLAVGVWLGGLRVMTGGVTAPALTHVLADLAAWWLV
jgi:membrane protease YdiL (CAAX protease family)